MMPMNNTTCQTKHDCLGSLPNEPENHTYLIAFHKVQIESYDSWGSENRTILKLSKYAVHNHFA